MDEKGEGGFDAKGATVEVEEDGGDAGEGVGDSAWESPTYVC